MNAYKVSWTSRFKKEYKTAIKRGFDISKLDEIIRMLANEEELPEAAHDHCLSGTWAGFRECHIEPDWLLVYKIDKGRLLLTLTRTGSHSDLFG